VFVFISNFKVISYISLGTYTFQSSIYLLLIFFTFSNFAQNETNRLYTTIYKHLTNWILNTKKKN